MTVEELAQELQEELETGTDTHPPTTYQHNDALLAMQREQLDLQSKTSRTNEDILAALKKIIERYESDDKDEALMYEWRQVAVAVDKVLFWVFFTGTLVSTLIVLVLVPVIKYSTEAT